MARVDPPRRPEAPPWWRVVALVLVCAVVPYLNSLGGELMYDDDAAVVNNDLVRTHDLRGVLGTPSWGNWATIGYVMYRPVTTLSFVANHRVHGLSPFGYHAVNLAAHAAVCALLAAIVWRLTGRALLAGLAAVFFAVHPIHTEAVASVVGRAELLAALFALLAWWLVLRGRVAARGRFLWGLAAAGCVFLAALCKESALVVLPMLLVTDVVRGHGTVRRELRTYAGLVVAAGSALLVWLSVTWGSVPSMSRLDNVLANAPLAGRLWTTLEVLGRYVVSLAWPLRLSADYSYRQIDVVASPANGYVFLAMGTMTASAVLAARSGRRDVHLALGILWVGLGGVASMTFLGLGAIMAERFLYLPSAGFCLLAAVGVLDLRASARATRRAVGVSVAIVIALASATATYARNHVWQSKLAFFESMVQDAPESARSHRELGRLYSQLGRHEEAIASFERSLAILRIDTTLHGLGNAYLAAKRHPEAIGAFREALALRPTFVEVIWNLGTTYSAAGDEETAEHWFRRGLELDPRNADLHMNLANSLLRRGRWQEAEPSYRTAVALAPRHATLRVNYATCLEGLGRLGDALEHYRAARSLEPDTLLFHVRLVAALARAGDLGAARAAHLAAARRFPGDRTVQELGRQLAQAAVSSGSVP